MSELINTARAIVESSDPDVNIYVVFDLLTELADEIERLQGIINGTKASDEATESKEETE